MGLQQTVLCGWEFILLLQHPQEFSTSGLRLYFPSPEPHVAQSVTRSTSCRSACPASQSATLLGPPAPALLRVLSTQLPVSAPPPGLDECFFFISLVVGLPYSSILCQFCFFFFFNCCSSFGCAMRHSVSTYASILAGRQNCEIF